VTCAWFTATWSGSKLPALREVIDGLFPEDAPRKDPDEQERKVASAAAAWNRAFARMGEAQERAARPAEES